METCKEWNKENDGNMSSHHYCVFEIETKNEEIDKNRDSLADPPPVFHMDKKKITDCELPEIVVSNYKEQLLTYNVVKDICVDEGVALMQEKFFFNETDSIKVIASYLESKSSKDNKFEKFVGIHQDSSKLDQDSQVPPSDVVATSTRNVSDEETLTLGDIISMEDSQKPPNNNNIHGPKENIVHEKEEPKGESLGYLSSEIAAEAENQLLNDVLEDSYDHNLFSNGFGEISLCEAESSIAHITYSGPISGSLSVLSDGSTIAIGMEQQSCKNGES